MKLTPIKTHVDDLRESINNRSNRIGGSDAGTVLGLNPYKSAYTLWAEMTGRIERPDLSNKVAVWEGTVLESAVADRFSEESGLKVVRSNMEYSLEEYPFMVGHIDRKVVGEYAGLECKTTSQLAKTEYGEGEIPAHYYAQCQFYMAVTGFDHWYIAILQHSKAFYWMRMERDEEYIETMINTLCAFHDKVVNDDAPEVDASESTEETIRYIYPTGDDEQSERDFTSYSKELNRLEEIKDLSKELSAEKRGIENKFKESLGESVLAYAPGWKITWKNQSRESIDDEALKHDHPDLYNKYLKSSDSRVLRVTKLKGKK